MKNQVLLALSLVMLIAVLIGVTIIQPITNIYPGIKIFTPAIIITGFFVFLISVGLFFYFIITNIKKR